MRRLFTCTQQPVRAWLAGWCGALLLTLPLLVAIAGCTPVWAAPSPPDVAGAYTMNVAFDEAQRTISGRLELDWRNHTGQMHSELPFRLYPNASQYEAGGTDVSAVTVNGESVRASTRPEDATVFVVPLPRPLPPGERVILDMEFVTRIPTDSGMAVSVLAGSSEAGWWLADWYPILAGWEPATGWFLDPPTSLGNPTFADAASYHLTFTLPAGYALASTGVALDEGVSSSGERMIRLEAPAARDLTLALVPDASVTERHVGDTLVRIVLPESLAVPGLAEAMLTIAAEVIPQYEAWFGVLPDSEIDLSPINLVGFGGIAWSGAIWLDLEALVGSGDLSPVDRDQLHFVVAHELAHQWFPIVVGSNNNRFGFMSESLANLLALRVIDATGDQDLAERLLRDHVVAPYAHLLETQGDGVVNAPITEATDLRSRGALVYGKGTLGFEAIRQHMGDAGFFGALAEFTTAHWLGVAEPADLLAAFTHRGGNSVASLWAFWFEQDTATLPDVEALTAP